MNFWLTRDLAASTIIEAKNSGLYTQGQINWMQETQGSSSGGDVILHRGIEKTLMDRTGFRSPSYHKNNSIIHHGDNNPSSVPSSK